MRLITARLICSLVCGLSLFACSSQPIEQTGLQIDGMIIENQTQAWVSAVRLLVPATGNFISCGNIPPGSMCSTTFPETRYTGNPVEVSWSQGGQIHSTGQFTLQLPDDLEKEISAVVQVVIAGPGSAGAVIVQRKD